MLGLFLGCDGGDDSTTSDDSGPYPTQEMGETTSGMPTGGNDICYEAFADCPARGCAEATSAEQCGGPLAPFDPRGCSRPPCTTDAECEPDTRCYRPKEEANGCWPTSYQCDCETCQQTDDCEGGYCVPK